MGAFQVGLSADNVHVQAVLFDLLARQLEVLVDTLLQRFLSLQVLGRGRSQDGIQRLADLFRDHLLRRDDDAADGGAVRRLDDYLLPDLQLEVPGLEVEHPAGALEADACNAARGY